MEAILCALNINRNAVKELSPLSLFASNVVQKPLSFKCFFNKQERYSLGTMPSIYLQSMLMPLTFSPPCGMMMSA